MPDSSFHLSKPTLAYAKLVATPNETSWSQVYNAGNLFACISLTVIDGEADDISLPTVGKEILDTLQAEFFGLEEKTIPSITDVIQKSLDKVPDSLTADMTVGFFKDSLLYLFIVGHGRVIMKRQGKTGILLESSASHKKILTASGYLNNEDTVILETKQFAEDITDETLASALELTIPNDIAEALSPQLHAKEDGGQAAIIVVYHGISKGTSVEESDEEGEETIGGQQYETESHQNIAPVGHHEAGEIQRQQEDELEEEDEDDEEEDEEEEQSHKKKKFAMPKLPSFGFLHGFASKFRTPSNFKLTHTRKLFLSITVILIVLLAASIFFTKKKEADAQIRQQFQQVYEPANRKYESAKALETLNKDHSYEDYVEAKKLLSENSSKFPVGTNERKQIDELLAKINTEIAGSSPVQNVNAKETSVSAQSFLGIVKANTDGKGFTQDDNAVYFVTDKAIVSVSKSSGTKAEIIKNNNAWEDAVGLSSYLGNLYVLDRKKGIIKFAAGGYSQSSYFKNKPDVSTARDLAIDSSVWILLGDGTILKYTSGTADSYKSPTLEKKMSGPAKIFTDANTGNLYILDRGNSRVIRFAKEGTGHSEYTSSVIKNARDFEVREKDKKILILSGDKAYEIAL
jgi:hypothetical protein